MKCIISILTACIAIAGAAQSLTLAGKDGGPAYYVPASGESVIIGDFKYVVIAEGDWTYYTNAVRKLEAVAERRWKKEHSTKEGRVSWHGREVKQEIVGLEKVTTYADGYTWWEQMSVKTNQPTRVRTNSTQAANSPRPALPARLQAKKDALSAPRTPRAVSVRFNAGGDAEVIKED